jgi:hypothetical protein
MSVTKEAVEKRIQKKQDTLKIQQFKAHQNIFIMTTRFNTQTRGENYKFRKKSWKNGCVYGAPDQVSQNIPSQSKLLVLEMDNDQNHIFAIGLCANRPIINKYSVYENNYYNRFNYVGKHRISRAELTPMEEAVFKALDQLCFFGSHHVKRGQGLKAFPTIFLVNCSSVINIPRFLEDMFSYRFVCNQTTHKNI